MNAASMRMDNIAHNVANVNTQDFAPQRLQQTEAAPAARSGAAVDTYEPTSTAAAQSRNVGTGTEAYAAGNEQPDLARDMTDMNTQRNAYSANAQVTRVQDSVIGQTLNLLG